MPTKTDFTFEQLLEAIRAYVSTHLPGRCPRALRITLDDGEKISHPVPFALLPTARPAPEQPARRQRYGDV